MNFQKQVKFNQNNLNSSMFSNWSNIFIWNLIYNFKSFNTNVCHVNQLKIFSTLIKTKLYEFKTIKSFIDNFWNLNNFFQLTLIFWLHTSIVYTSHIHLITWYRLVRLKSSFTVVISWRKGTFWFMTVKWRHLLSTCFVCWKGMSFWFLHSVIYILYVRYNFIQTYWPLITN